MGCCCSSNEDKNPISIAVVGLPGVGKTSLIEYLADDYNPEDPPVATNGIIQRQVHIHRHLYHFYDVCGYTSHSDEWVECCEKSDAIIFLFDPFSLKKAKMHNSALIKTLAPTISKKNIPVLALLNKAEGETTFSETATELKNAVPNVPFYSNEISQFSQDVYRIFEWIESYTV